MALNTLDAEARTESRLALGEIGNELSNRGPKFPLLLRT